MKLLFISTLVAAFSVNTFASTFEWRDIESKQCGQEAPVAVKDESIAILSSHSLVAFKKKDEAGCKYADFYSVLTSSSTLVNGKSFKTFIPVQAISRKNCRNELSDAPPAFFTSLESSEDQIILSQSADCQTLVLKLKPKAPQE